MVEQLGAKWKLVGNKFEELKEARDEAWENTKVKMENTWHEFKDSLESVASDPGFYKCGRKMMNGVRLDYSKSLIDAYVIFKFILKSRPFSFSFRPTSI